MPKRSVSGSALRGSELTSVRSILGLKPDPAIDDLPPGGSSSRSTAAFPRARSSRRVILNQDQRIRLDGVTLPLTQSDLCESAYDAGAIGFLAKFLVQTTLPHRRQSGSHYTRTDGRFTLRISIVATRRKALSRSGASVPSARHAPLNSSISPIRERTSGEIWMLAVSNIVVFKHIYTHTHPYGQQIAFPYRHP